jgi:hypothetical protein
MTLSTTPPAADCSPSPSKWTTAPLSGDPSRVLHIEAATPEAAAQKVSQLAGVGGFIESIRPMSEQWLPL